MIGYFQIHRALFNHPIWTKEQFTWAQAWVDLVGNANFKPNTFFIRDTEIHLDRGQIAWSQLTMCDRWKWSRGRTRRFLSYLENEQMIVQHTGHLTTLITICNYNKYQTPDVEGGTTRDTADGTQLNKDKKVKKGNTSRFAPPSVQDVHEYMKTKGFDNQREAQKFIDFYESKNWMVGKNKMTKWRSSVSGWLSRSQQRGELQKSKPKDTRTYEQIKKDDLTHMDGPPGIVTDLAARKRL